MKKLADTFKALVVFWFLGKFFQEFSTLVTVTVLHTYSMHIESLREFVWIPNAVFSELPFMHRVPV